MTAEIEQMSKNLIERALGSTNWNYVTDRDGDLQVRFKQATKLGSMPAWFMLSKSEDCLKCHGLYGIEIGKENISTALYLCNEFNSKYSFPCAYVYHPENSDGSFRCQAFFDLEKGIHLEGLTNFILSFTGSYGAFEKWVCEQPEFWQ